MAYYTNPIYGYYPQAQPMMPVLYPQQMIEQPQQSSGNQSNDSNSLMVWVQGKAGAQSYPVARGTTLPLFDSEGDYVYIKSVDNNGIPLPLVTKMISTPAAVEEYNNISREVEIPIPRGCCQNVSVTNTSTQDIEIQNAIIDLDRIS